MESFQNIRQRLGMTIKISGVIADDRAEKFGIEHFEDDPGSAAAGYYVVGNSRRDAHHERRPSVLFFALGNRRVHALPIEFDDRLRIQTKTFPTNTCR